MNDIPVITIHDGRPLADSRDVAKDFERQHKVVLLAYRELKCSEEFKRHNFMPVITKDLAGSEYTSHVMMTRDGFMFLVMGFTGEKAARVKEAWIARFNAMEAELMRRPQAPVFDVRDPGHVTNALLQSLQYIKELEQEKVTLQEQNIEQALRIEKAEPKERWYDKFAHAEGVWGLRESAKALGVSQTAFIRWLGAHGYIFRENGRWTHYSKWNQHDIFWTRQEVVVTPAGNDRAISQLMITAKGLQHFARKMGLDKPPAPDFDPGEEL